MPHGSRKQTRRSFLKQLGTAALVTPAFRWASFSFPYKYQQQLLYVGTYTTNTASEGIYIIKLDPRSGKLTQQKVVTGVTDPSFLTIDRLRRHLYAVNETDEFNGMNSGAVSAFSIDRRSGDLSFLNKQPSMGGSPCYLSLSRNGRFVLVANYVGGNVAVLPIGKDGHIGAAVDIRQHQGSGPVTDRQQAAHAHWIDSDRTGRFAAACDLGADKVFVYRFDSRTGKLNPNSAHPFYQTVPGAGPRHFIFHPNGKFAYLINELNATIDAMLFDVNKGTLTGIQSVSTLPPGWTGENTCAEIQLSPNGDFLYGSNRGHDSIVSYQVDRATAKLSLIEHVSSGGKGPRNFVIDPTGTYLLAANQRSDNIVIFKVEPRTGRLQTSGSEFKLPSPVCLKLAPAG